METNSISKEFNFTSLIKFTVPSILMIIFIAMYSIVDGVFVSRFINTDALSAFNIVYPFINVVIGIGVMLASGGSAIIARKIGEKNVEEAKQNFTFIIISGLIIGIIIAILGYIFSEKMIYMLGATEELYDYCQSYLYMALIFVPMYIVNLLYQMLTITAGKPNIGLILTVVGGVTNIILDYVFIEICGMGIAGAALATGLGNLIPVIMGTIYFMKTKDMLHFVKFKFDFKVLFDTCINGSSEMVNNLATGITTILFNIIMIRLLGANGVAAMSIVLYGQFLVTAIFIGFASGVAPIISYNYGEGNRAQSKKIIKYSFIFIAISSVVCYVLSMVFVKGIVGVFSPEGTEVYKIGYNGFIIFGVSFLMTGFNIFIATMFTAFSNGKISALISVIRSFIFLGGAILILPNIFGVNGIWLAVPVAEGLALIVALIFFYIYRKKYGYDYKKSEDSGETEEIAS